MIASQRACSRYRRPQWLAWQGNKRFFAFSTRATAETLLSVSIPLHGCFLQVTATPLLLSYHSSSDRLRPDPHSHTAEVCTSWCNVKSRGVGGPAQQASCDIALLWTWTIAADVGATSGGREDYTAEAASIALPSKIGNDGLDAHAPSAVIRLGLPMACESSQVFLYAV